MKDGNLTNQIVTKAFFEATRDIIAKNTSSHYSEIAMNGIRDKLDEEFKFLKNIHIKEKSIDVDESINSVGEKELKKFFTTIVDLIGPDYLKILLTKKLDPEEILYLENLGLEFG